ncbi:MAG: mercuric reductase [Candidatus Bipolaricaulota bacterium]
MNPSGVLEGTSYDAIIIGAGQGGSPLAGALAKAGWKTALIERKHVGGTCVNEGCTPTKTMVASARVAHLAGRAADYGVHIGPLNMDMRKVRQRKRDIVERFRSGSRKRLERTEGLDLFMGEARFSGPKTVEVALNEGGQRTLSAETIVINTGTRPRMPAISGIEDVPVLDSTSIMELAEVPEHLLVIGGGYVGLEFGQMFRRFGSRVTLVQRSGQLVPHEDADVAEEISAILQQDGIEVLLGTQPIGARAAGNRSIQLTVRNSEGKRTLTGSHLLLAAGRTPNSDRLNLASAGIKATDRGFVPVNDRLETVVPGVYALGDVKGGPAFTHISYDDYRILRTNLLESGEESTAGRLVPYTVFTDPQLGRVGLTEKEARSQGLDYRVAKIPMTWVARALETDETRGLMKAIVDAESDRILGAAILSVEGGEVMAALQVAMMGGVSYTAIRDGAFAHPTLAESLNTLFGAMEG